MQSHYGPSGQTAKGINDDIDVLTSAVSRPTTSQRIADRINQNGEREKFSLKQGHRESETNTTKKSYNKRIRFVLSLLITFTIAMNARIELSLNHQMQSHYGPSGQTAKGINDDIDVLTSL